MSRDDRGSVEVVGGMGLWRAGRSGVAPRRSAVPVRLRCSQIGEAPLARVWLGQRAEGAGALDNVAAAVYNAGRRLFLGSELPLKEGGSGADQSPWLVWRRGTDA